MNIYAPHLLSGCSLGGSQGLRILTEKAKDARGCQQAPAPDLYFEKMEPLALGFEALVVLHHLLHDAPEQFLD